MTAKAGFTRRAEPLKWTVNATVAKWTADQVAALGDQLGHEPNPGELAAYAVEPELVEQPGNLLTTAGLTLIMNRLAGTAGTMSVDNAHTRLGVGNGNAAEAAGQADLQAAAGAANRWFMTMDTGYPQVNAGVLTARATFQSADGNFQWQEWGLDVNTAGNAAAGATVANVLLNRKVATLGTKAAGAVWQLTVTITLT